MRSTKSMTFKLLSLAAVLVGAVGLAACGGGGSLPGSTTLLLGGPVLTPPPPGTNLPDPIPLPPGGGGGSPVDPVDPAPVDPPADPPTEPQPIVDPPDPTPDALLAQVRAMAVVPENPLVAEAPEAYIGVYVADEDGRILRRHDESGDWREVADLGDGVTVEAMTYVAPLHALYLALASGTGTHLARFLLTPTPAVWDMAVEPPALLDAGGEQLQMIDNSAGQAFVRLQTALGVVLAERASFTGLAFDTGTNRLYAWDHDMKALFRFSSLNVADATLVCEFNLVGTLSVDDVQDMAYDRANERMLLVDAASAQVIELDHLGLAFHQVVTLPYADIRALAWVEGGDRLAVDRASAALIRFDANGAVLE